MTNMVQSLRRLALAALFPLMMLVTSACDDAQVAPPTSQESAVTGTVLDRHGNMVPEALVEAVDGSGRTIAIDTADVMGKFELTGIPADPGGLLLKVTPLDLPPITRGLSGFISDAGGRTGGTVLMTGSDSCCGTLRLTVTGSNSGPLGGVQVQFRRGDRTYRTGVTDSNGVVVFREVCDGEFNFRLSRDGYNVVERGDLSLSECDSQSYSFQMTARTNTGGDDTCCRGVMRFTVTDSASGASINNAEVRILRVGGNTRTARTEDGTVTFREVCQGTYNVRIARDGYRVVEFRVEIGCNGEASYSRTLTAETGGGNDSCCSGRVEVVVRDSASNDRLSGATVRLWRGSTLVATRTTSGTTNAVFEGLCQGDNYSISISRDGYRGIEYDFDVTCDQRVEILRLLSRTTSGNDSCCDGRLQVNLRDSTSNNALSNVTVRLWRNGSVHRSGTTNANGYLVFEGLCQGNYGIDFTRDGYRAREATIELGCNANREMSWRLLSTESSSDSCCTASMALRIKDSAYADGGWLEGATVVISYGSSVIAQGTTNGDGRYVREELCGYRTYTVTISKTGFATKSVTFTYTACRRIEETIRLTRN